MLLERVSLLSKGMFHDIFCFAPRNKRFDRAPISFLFAVARKRCLSVLDNLTRSASLHSEEDLAWVSRTGRGNSGASRASGGHCVACWLRVRQRLCRGSAIDRLKTVADEIVKAAAGGYRPSTRPATGRSKFGGPSRASVWTPRRSDSTTPGSSISRFDALRSTIGKSMIDVNIKGVLYVSLRPYLSSSPTSRPRRQCHLDGRAQDSANQGGLYAPTKMRCVRSPMLSVQGRRRICGFTEVVSWHEREEFG